MSRTRWSRSRTSTRTSLRLLQASVAPSEVPGSAIGAALVERLASLTPERIVEFHRCFTHVARRAHRWDQCAAAFVIWGYHSDDGFSDFKAGLVGLGRDTFERVVAMLRDSGAEVLLYSLPTGLQWAAEAYAAAALAAGVAFVNCTPEIVCPRL